MLEGLPDSVQERTVERLREYLEEISDERGGIKILAKLHQNCLK